MAASSLTPEMKRQTMFVPLVINKSGSAIASFLNDAKRPGVGETRLCRLCWSLFCKQLGPCHPFSCGFWVNAIVYTEVLDTVAKLWIEGDSRTRSRRSLAHDPCDPGMADQNFHEHVTSKMWPSSSSVASNSHKPPRLCSYEIVVT